MLESIKNLLKVYFLMMKFVYGIVLDGYLF